jgi:hypothetical protein
MRLSEQIIATTSWITVDASNHQIELEMKSRQDVGVSLTHSDLGKQVSPIKPPD